MDYIYIYMHAVHNEYTFYIQHYPTRSYQIQSHPIKHMKTSPHFSWLSPLPCLDNVNILLQGEFVVMILTEASGQIDGSVAYIELPG